ncbi:MAG: gas vesicle protein GvpC [Blastocatellia bacterium]|nr:gas vesicle protein GvpC [Blastocatellia bacterium]
MRQSVRELLAETGRCRMWQAAASVLDLGPISSTSDAE